MHLMADSARSTMAARSRRNERGAVLIEAVFVFPVMIMLTMGILEFGMAFSSVATTTASSRSGARLAATLYAPASGGAAKLAVGDQVAAAVTADLKALTSATPVGMVMYKVDQTSDTGAPIGGFPTDTMGGCSSECLKYNWDSSQKKLVYSSGTWPDPQACVTPNSTIDMVGVFVITNHHFVTKLFGSNKVVHGKTIMRLEPLPTDSC
jgi:Flp pilus assembly protein TadG